MTHINLLPWRERLREERKREFLTILAGVVFIAAGILFLVHTYITGEINTQLARNEFMETELRLLDERVTEINQLRQQKQDIRARMNVITDLQRTRPVIVRIFDELVKTLPEGVYYQSLNRVDNTISIEGRAESYARITELLRALADSEWFQEVELDDIAAAEDFNSQSEAFTFSLSLNLQLQVEQEEG
ncbi:MAG: PilN domain-containing protein [Pseudohongiella sp.]|jgi:type IV pilus assembly protein PilN|nr:PilN domain-containing protein [Pseudohongiella sp.]